MNKISITKRKNIFINPNHFHYNNLWIVDFICRFSKQHLGLIPNSVTRSWNSLKSSLPALHLFSISQFLWELGAAHVWIWISAPLEWLTQWIKSESKTWLNDSHTLKSINRIEYSVAGNFSLYTLEWVAPRAQNKTSKQMSKDLKYWWCSLERFILKCKLQ